MVGGVWDQTTPHFPLYIVEALVVEAVASRIDVRDTLRFALVAGAGIGTLDDEVAVDFNIVVER